LQGGKKDYVMENGDAIIGSSSHGVPKDNSINGRISIVTFLVPKNNDDLIQQFQLLNI